MAALPHVGRRALRGQPLQHQDQRRGRHRLKDGPQGDGAVRRDAGRDGGDDDCAIRHARQHPLQPVRQRAVRPRGGRCHPRAVQRLCQGGDLPVRRGLGRVVQGVVRWANASQCRVCLQGLLPLHVGRGPADFAHQGRRVARGPGQVVQGLQYGPLRRGPGSVYRRQPCHLHHRAPRLQQHPAGGGRWRPRVRAGDQPRHGRADHLYGDVQHPSAGHVRLFGEHQRRIRLRHCPGLPGPHRRPRRRLGPCEPPDRGPRGALRPQLGLLGRLCLARSRGPRAGHARRGRPRRVCHHAQGRLRQPCQQRPRPRQGAGGARRRGAAARVGQQQVLHRQEQADEGHLHRL
mmetsp:Transcript_36477/g.88668  ORF Transcript_36477/g.88668 Transcript_36477/m.88668 type:complete len:346 (+) Transcript_36477:4976-6013(+)